MKTLKLAALFIIYSSGAFAVVYDDPIDIWNSHQEKGDIYARVENKNGWFFGMFCSSSEKKPDTSAGIYRPNEDDTGIKPPIVAIIDGNNYPIPEKPKYYKENHLVIKLTNAIASSKSKYFIVSADNGKFQQRFSLKNARSVLGKPPRETIVSDCGIWLLTGEKRPKGSLAKVPR